MEMKILTFEDGKFVGKGFGKTLLIGLKTEDTLIEDIYFREIEIDGLDATEKAIEIINEAKPIDIIFLNGISYAGFNLIDAEKIWMNLGIPLIIYTKKKPDNKKVISALIKHFPDWRIRWDIIKNTLKASRGVHQVKIKSREKPVYIEVIGIGLEEATKILKNNTIWGRTPEPIRIIEIIAEESSKVYLQVKNK